MTITPGTDHIKLTISYHQRQMLRLIAERSGRVDFQFGTNSVQLGSNFSEAEKATICKDSDESIRGMEKMGLITITPIVGYQERFSLALTDIGRNVVDQMRLMINQQINKVTIRGKIK